MAEPYDNTTPRFGSFLNILSGAWLMAAPSVLGYSLLSNARQNEFYTGILIILFALVGIAGTRIAWSRWLNIVFGIWLFFSPFILGYAGVSRALWNEVIMGVLVVIFASWSLGSIVRQEPQALS